MSWPTELEAVERLAVLFAEQRASWSNQHRTKPAKPRVSENDRRQAAAYVRVIRGGGYVS